MMSRQDRQSGLILIEVVTTLILIGFIGAFAGFFLYNGISGFLTSKKTSEAALKAQIALDRISAELKHINSLPNPPVANTSITYQSSDFTGTRQIQYNAANRELSLIAGGTAYLLLDQVATFTLNWTSANLDNADDDEEVSAINIGFSLTDVGTTFNVRIYPRSLINRPT
jgi:hypothetical protein